MMTSARKIAAVLFALATLAAADGCTHVVSIESPADPVELSVTIEVRHEIHVGLRDAGA
jgi:hypothetical protein